MVASQFSRNEAIRPSREPKKSAGHSAPNTGPDPDFAGVVTDVAITDAAAYLSVSETNRRSPLARRIWNRLFGLADICAT